MIRYNYLMPLSAWLLLSLTAAILSRNSFAEVHQLIPILVIFSCSAAIVYFVSVVSRALISRLVAVQTEKASHSLQMANEELLQTQRSLNAQISELSETNQKQTDLLQAVSRQLKVPMSLLKGPIQQWQESIKPCGESETQAQLVLRNLERLEATVQQLDLVADNKTHSIHESELLDLTGLVGSVCHLYQSRLSREGIYIDFQVENSYSIFGSEMELNILVAHLLCQAIQAAPKHSQIAISLHDKGSELVLSFTDTGRHGDESEPLFSDQNEAEYLQFAHHSQTVFSNNVIHAIVKRHKATMLVGTNAEQGNVVKIYFSTYSKRSLDTSIEDKDTYSPVFFSPEKQELLEFSTPFEGAPKCLIVDTESDSKLYIARLLQKEFSCTAVGSIKTAWEQLLHWQPDVVICNHELADGSGLDLVEKMRSESLTEDLPILMLGSSFGSEHKTKAINLNVNMFLEQPFDPHMFLHTTRKWAQTYRASQHRQAIEKHVHFQDSRDTRFLAQLNGLIEKNIACADFHFEDYFEQFSMSKRQFFRRVNNLTRCTPKQYLIEKRLELARYLLGQGHDINEVTKRCGFRDHQSLLKLYVAHFREPAI